MKIRVMCPPSANSLTDSASRRKGIEETRRGPMMEEKMVSGTVSDEAMERISQRLSSLDNLYFPRALQSDAADPSQRKAILMDLLSRDAALFLERYGSQLTCNELFEFDVLRDDYEINWHLQHLRRILSPTSEELKTRSLTVKNRRRAYLDKLICDGQYFSEDAMREREPYLHHEYIGKFQDPTGRAMARPGERLSETLMRMSEEAILVAKIRGEQQRLGISERDWVGFDRNQEEVVEEEQEEDEDSDGIEYEDEEEEEDEDGNDKTRYNSQNANNGELNSDPPDATKGEASSSGKNEEESLSAEEMEDRMEQFTYVMQQKFLLGEDYEHLDYSKIDNDETLDDHWQREANFDAEEKYFDED